MYIYLSNFKNPQSVIPTNIAPLLGFPHSQKERRVDAAARAADAFARSLARGERWIETYVWHMGEACGCIHVNMYIYIYVYICIYICIYIYIYAENLLYRCVVNNVLYRCVSICVCLRWTTYYAVLIERVCNKHPLFTQSTHSQIREYPNHISLSWDDWGGLSIVPRYPELDIIERSNIMDHTPIRLISLNYK